MTDHSKIPGFPKIHAQLTDEHHGTVTVNGLDHPVRKDDLTEVRRAVIDHVVGIAGKVHRPVKMESADPDGTRWHLVVHPDGTVEEDQSAETAPAKPDRSKPKKTETEQPPSPAREEGPQAERTPVGEHVEEPQPDVPHAPAAPPPQEAVEGNASVVNLVYNEEPRSGGTAERGHNTAGHDQGPLPAPGRAEAPHPPVFDEGGLEYSAVQWENAINENNQARGFSGLVHLMRRVIASPLPRTESGEAYPGPAHQK